MDGMKKNIIRQNFIDLARTPDRGAVLTVYNENILLNKELLTDAFRKYLDSYPGWVFNSEGEFIIEFPVRIRRK